MTADIVEYLCRHLIGIGWYEGSVRDDGKFAVKPTFFGASGFVLQLHDRLPRHWALITAGHVYTEYKKRLSDPRIGARSHSLFDCWGPHSRIDQRIPFNLFDTPNIHKFDRDAGIDYAVVPLPEHIFKLISQTTVPFTKKNWIHQSDTSFDYFALLGLPNEKAMQTTSSEDGIGSITTFQNPVLLRLERCEPPTEATQESIPQFAAKISPGIDLQSIVGMSGGPVFGFRETADGELTYWPVAIQSRWLRDSRIVLGMPIRPVAAWIEEELERFIAQC